MLRRFCSTPNPDVSPLNCIYYAVLTVIFLSQTHSLDVLPQHAQFTHWECVTERARVMLRQNPHRMEFAPNLDKEGVDLVLADIDKARNKRKLSRLTCYTQEDMERMENDRADRKAEKRRYRDMIYGTEYKNHKRLARIRRKWEKHQEKIGSNLTWQDDYNQV